MRKILTAMFFIITPIIIWGQSNCEVCDYVEQLKKEITVLKIEIEKIKRYTDALEKELKSKDIKIRSLKKRVAQLEKNLNEILTELKDTKVVKDGLNTKLAKVTADYKKDTAESNLMLRNYQIEIANEKRAKDSLYSTIGKMEENYNILKISLANIWTKNLPLNIDSTFIVPYDQDFIKVNYRRVQSDDYRLDPDEYANKFMNNLKWLLKQNLPNITLTITIEGRKKNQDRITRSIKNQLRSYLDNDSYEITFIDENRSMIYFRFKRSGSSKLSSGGK